MNLNDLFKKEGIDPLQVLVLRHRPTEPAFRKVLPWLAAERPEMYNAYQQTQGEKLEKALQKAAYVASFIGHKPGKALFVGLYQIGKSKPLTYEQFWKVPAYIEMKKLGMRGFSPKEGRSSILWFDLTPKPFYSSWKGRLIIGWPGAEISWWRRAHKNDFPILTVLEDSTLVPVIPEWHDIVFKWDQLDILPTHWKAALSQWRGVYYIFDDSDGKGYVGSAYGKENILGRWENYAASGHGGNKLLRKRDPKRFQFSILQRVSPDMEADDIVELEASWKNRLHTRAPHGLNEN